MKSTKDDSWSSINSFGSKKVESTSSPSINDLRYGRSHQPSNQLNSKHQVINKKKIKMNKNELKMINKGK